MNTENVLSKAEGGAAAAEHTRSGRFFRPHVDIVEKAEELLLLADVPGADGDAIDIRFEDGELTLHGKVEPRQGNDRRYLHQEYDVGDFYRTFQISEAIDAGKISADYGDGVLTLHLPKAESVKLRKIAVAAK
ncbi:MAG: Hsp20/alpha crystallin family protein [Pirellulales bacterium]|nr:Hsp20/alpha crystallin family protein [Pirellulales bacterium]